MADSTKLERTSATPGKVSRRFMYQETYFVLDGVDAWPRLDLAELEPIWETLDRQSDLDPGDLLPEDALVNRGAGTYHTARKVA